jgi:hypothetical protein
MRDGGLALAERSLEDWRDVFDSTVTAAVRTGPRQLRLQLRRDPAAIATVVGLAQKEKACCSFFAFTCEIGVDTVELVVEVPAGAEAALDAFANTLA